MIASTQFVLRDYQREATDRSVRFLTAPLDTHGLVVLPTGSGKSLVIASIVKELQAPSLVFQPSREILKQNFAKLVSYGFRPAVYSASLGKKQISGAVTLATIGSVIRKWEHFEHVKYILVDECFVSGTIICGRQIQYIKPGDLVTTFDHSSGRIVPGFVKAVSCRMAPDVLYKITINGKATICTPNHPFYVPGRGYIEAQYLRIGEQVYVQTKPSGNHAVRSLRRSSSTQELSPLLESHADRSRISPGLRVQGSSEGIIDPNEGKESNAERRNQAEDGAFTTADRASAEDSGRERSRPFGAAKAATCATERGMDPGNEHPFHASQEGRIPTCIQTRSGIPSEEDWSGDRRAEPLLSADTGHKKRNCPYIARVDSVEAYKRGSNGKYPDGRRYNYVYNLQIEGNNNNYFANGVLVHNCHLVNAGAGMYKEFFEKFAGRGLRILGLTATPYRLTSTMEGPILKFLTRTRPRVFSELIYYVQNERLFRDGHLAKLQYHQIKGFDRSKLRSNSTGADYTDESIQKHFRELDFSGKLERVVLQLLEIGRKGVLVFTRFLDESRWLCSRIPEAVMVSAETPDAERDRILKEFRAGKIRVVCNVGVLTTGFDYPELDTVVLARPTMSLALYYQMTGRVVRPHPSKEHAMVVDMVGLMEQFGKVEDLRIVSGANKKWFVASGSRQLTNVFFGSPRG